MKVRGDARGYPRPAPAALDKMLTVELHAGSRPPGLDPLRVLLCHISLGAPPESRRDSWKRFEALGVVCFQTKLQGMEQRRTCRLDCSAAVLYAADTVNANTSLYTSALQHLFLFFLGGLV